MPSSGEGCLELTLIKRVFFLMSACMSMLLKCERGRIREWETGAAEASREQAFRGTEIHLGGAGGRGRALRPRVAEVERGQGSCSVFWADIRVGLREAG